jgi:paraquat-inducible protein A
MQGCAGLEQHTSQDKETGDVHQPAQTVENSVTLIACHECDTLHRLPELRPGRTLRCSTCNAVLLNYPRGGLDRPIALYLSAAILFVFANIFPFLTLDIQGREEMTTLVGASAALYSAGMGELAVVVAITSVLGPALIIASCLYVLLGVRLGLRLPGLRTTLSWVSHLEPWGMLDVFMLGVLVSFVKLAGMATIHIGLSLYAFVGLILFSAAASAAFEPHLLWHKLGYPREAAHAGH